MAYPSNLASIPFNNPSYNNLQTNLQQQTMALLRQRQSLSNNKYSSSFNYHQSNVLKPAQSESYTKNPLVSSRSNYSKNVASNAGKNISDKLRQIINQCKQENTNFGQELTHVLNEERGIYDALNIGVKTPRQHGRTNLQVNDPIIEAQKQSSVVHDSRQNFNVQSHLNAQTATRQSLKSGQKSLIRQALEKNSKHFLEDDLLQMIQQIQRKALDQIQKLREQKIDLIKQLKNEVQSNNDLQRELNAFSQIHSQAPRPSNQAISPEVLSQIRAEMDNLRQENQNLRSGLNRNNNQTFGQTPEYVSHQTAGLKNRVTLLQNEVQERNRIIQQLLQQVKNQNNFSNGQTQNTNLHSNSQFIQLLEQGQSIRQNTVHLLRLKQGTSDARGNFGSSQQLLSRIRELQQMLDKQEQQKQSFLNDLLKFKQKYNQLEEQNKSLKPNIYKYQESRLNGPSFSRISQSPAYMTSYKYGVSLKGESEYPQSQFSEHPLHLFKRY